MAGDGEDEVVSLPKRLLRLPNWLYKHARRRSDTVQEWLLWLTVAGYVLVVVTQLVGWRTDHHLQALQCGPHRPELSVDLTSSPEVDGVRAKSGVAYPPDAVWQHQGHVRGCPCRVRRCFRVCEGEFSLPSIPNITYPLWSLLEPGEAVDHSHPEMIRGEDIYFIHGLPDCSAQSGMFDALYENVGAVKVMVDGRVMSEDLEYLDVNDYCLELTGPDAEAHRCVKVSPLQYPKAWDVPRPPGSHRVVLVLSLVAMLITISLHLYLPQLRNLHGKLLVGCLVFLSVNYLQFLVGYHRWPVQFEYLWQYTYLGCVCWLSTIGFDVWLIIRGQVQPYDHEREGVLLLRYSLFACGCPAVLCGLTWAASVVPYREDACPRPRFADDSCRFTKEVVTQVFYHVPVGVLALLNMLLYLFMLYNVKVHPRPPCNSPLAHASLVAKQGFQLYTRLARVMALCCACLLLMTSTGVRECALVRHLLVLLYFCQGILVFAALCCNVRAAKLWLQKRLESSLTEHQKDSTIDPSEICHSDTPV